nr:MAG TPA: hypothetical protein [Caudoviricetes sp.]
MKTGYKKCNLVDHFRLHFCHFYWYVYRIIIEYNKNIILSEINKINLSFSCRFCFYMIKCLRNNFSHKYS